MICLIHAIMISFVYALYTKTFDAHLFITWMIHAVDRWRVVLKGETPDYINATNVHVSIEVYSIM